MESTNPKRTIIFLFSGQGSQYRGMGRPLFETNPTFAQSLKESDAFVQQQLGRSIIEEIYYEKGTPFDDLLITHPAIVAVELAILAVLKDLNVQPNFVVGNSLGEFAAGVAANIWTKEMALEAAVEQAKAIVDTIPEGGMLAILKACPEVLAPFLNNQKLFIASTNFQGHLTLSGLTNHLETLEKLLLQKDIPYLRLPVRYPFHTPLIESAKSDFLYYTYTSPPLDIAPIHFISGYNPTFTYKKLPNDYFWQAIQQSTNFSHLVQYLEKKAPCSYIDLGASGTSATFVKYNLKETSQSTIHSIMTPYQQEIMQLKKLKSLLNK